MHAVPLKHYIKNFTALCAAFGFGFLLLGAPLAPQTAAQTAFEFEDPLAEFINRANPEAAAELEEAPPAEPARAPNVSVRPAPTPEPAQIAQPPLKITPPAAETETPPMEANFFAQGRVALQDAADDIARETRLPAITVLAALATLLTLALLGLVWMLYRALKRGRRPRLPDRAPNERRPVYVEERARRDAPYEPHRRQSLQDFMDQEEQERARPAAKSQSAKSAVQAQSDPMAEKPRRAADTPSMERLKQSIRESWPGGQASKSRASREEEESSDALLLDRPAETIEETEPPRSKAAAASARARAKLEQTSAKRRARTPEPAAAPVYDDEEIGALLNDGPQIDAPAAFQEPAPSHHPASADESLEDVLDLLAENGERDDLWRRGGADAPQTPPAPTPARNEEPIDAPSASEILARIRAAAEEETTSDASAS